MHIYSSTYKCTPVQITDTHTHNLIHTHTYKNRYNSQIPNESFEVREGGFNGAGGWPLVVQS